MTERLFNKDAYIKDFCADVVTCEEKDGKYYVVLEKTAFFPEMGGQKGDKGFIGDAEVIDTVEKNGEIYHICTSAVNGDVDCSLDFNRRFNTMQGHSGEHIFSGIAHRLYGCENVGFHMGEGYITVDFDRKLDEEQIKTVEFKSNQAVWANDDIEILYPTDEEAETLDYRSKKEILSDLRIVKIGEVDICACCGTHVKKTGEIGIIKVGAFQNYKGGVRITLYIGADGLNDYCIKQDNIAHIANELSAKIPETAENFDKYVQTVGKLKLENAELKNRYFDFVAEKYRGCDYAFVFEKDIEPGELGKLCGKIAENAKTAVVVSGTDEDGYKYAVCSDTDLREKCKKFNSLLNGRGGGKPNCVQGSVKTDLATLERTAEEVFRG